MRKITEHGVSYLVVPFGTSRQLFLVAEPEENYLCSGDNTQGHGQTVADWPRQIRSLLESCQTVLCREHFNENTAIIGQFFLADIGKKELVRQIFSEFFPKHSCALTFIPQSPASGAVISLELWAVGGGTSITVKSPQSGFVVTAEFDDLRWFFIGDVRPDSLPVGAYARSLDAFQHLGHQLEQNGFQTGQIVRIWIYQGHLVLPEGKTQRYKELNRARTDVFKGVEFLKDFLPLGSLGGIYPASTGIGADDVDVVIGAIAVSTCRKDFIAVPLENPNQTSAFDYGAVYSPQSPKFSRAMAITAGDSCLVFISGTASITESESRFPENPEKQTEQTLDNIAALIDGKNLERHGISGFVSDLSHLKSARVYVKRPNELAVIKKVCGQRLGNIPILYTIADVCRPELLVEIEGFVAVNR
jgi:enamine deaminase RidA (YjgF/YER057c/UK114 family)